MKVIPDYKKSAFIVPGAVLELLPEADSSALCVLLYVLGHGEFSVTASAKALKISEAEFLSALKFWQDNDIISSEVGKTSKKAKNSSLKVRRKNDGETEAVENTVKPKPKMSSSLPSYTTEETARFLESNKTTAEIIDSCENIIGKIFTTAETNIIIGMLDHLSLSGEYILLLFAHAKKIGKNSVRYIEQLAISFADRDITTYSALEEELSHIELTEDTLRFIRKIFGFGDRAFSRKEKDAVRNWCVKWGFEKDIIEKAYEITVNNIGKASVAYTNSILAKWYGEGLHTVAEIDAYLEKSRSDSNKAADSSTESSFDTDEFFEAALRRSYGKQSDN
ncbi:MAG: DnaD domain protein [Clostridiales bacterium]|nr:DnaD domain protein [Clostridiales bacterium]